MRGTCLPCSGEGVSALRTAAERSPWAVEGLARTRYTSRLDGHEDWALVLPAERDTWVVCIHGHGSAGDQLFTRPDLRERWLPAFRRRGLGVLCPHLRGNCWMGPAAAHDLRHLLARIVRAYGPRRFLFASGSMGGTSNLIFATLHPEWVAGVIARGAATDLASYHAWCSLRRSTRPILGRIARAIEESYGGSPAVAPATYARHSPLARADRLMGVPIFLAHGEADRTIPVSQARGLADALRASSHLLYEEIPGGDHDSPLHTNSHPHPLDWILARTSELGKHGSKTRGKGGDPGRV